MGEGGRVRGRGGMKKERKRRGKSEKGRQRERENVERREMQRG